MLDAVFTIIAKNYLAQARTLMRSLAETDPGVARFVVLVDQPEEEFDPSAEDFTVVSASTLSIPQSAWFRFKYNVLELNTAVKPYAARRLFEKFPIGKLVYLDPDVRVYQPLSTSVFRRLDHADVLLTPHLTAELDDGRKPDEQTMLQMGCYNLGFVGLRRGDNTNELLRWWAERLYDRCLARSREGLFVDQKWMDLAPALFQNVEIVRDQTWNVAYWNLPSRPVSLRGGVPHVGREPLIFFHFSGFDPRRPEALSRHQDRYTPAKLGDVARLLDGYRGALIENGFDRCSSWTYSWSRFADGTPVPDILRDVLSVDPTLADRVEDPFSADGKEAFLATWNRPATGTLDEALGLTAAAAAVHAGDESVRSSMPDPFGADRRRFLEWITSHGAHRYRLPEEILAPLRKALSEVRAEPERAGAAPVLPIEPEDWVRRIAETLPALRERLADVLDGRELNAETLEDVFDDLNAPIEGRGERAGLTTLAHHILARRSDVAERFQTACEIDYARVYAWLLSYGRREYLLPERVLSPMRRQWRRHVRAMPAARAASAVSARLFLAAAAQAAGKNGVAAGLAPAPAVFARSGPVGRRPAPAASPIFRRSDELGVNVVGYARAEMGVGEAARRSVAALDAAGVPVGIVALSTAGTYPEKDGSLRRRSEGRYAFDLVHVNADQFPSVVDGPLANRHSVGATIGYWAWEIEHFPERFHDSFRYCREIWTLSEFTREALAAHSPAPVHAFPPPIRRVTAQPIERERFGLTKGAHVYLTMVDMLSVFERKNPLAAVEAFRAAWDRIPGSELAIKINSADKNPWAADELRKAAAGLPVRFIEETLSRDDMDGLIAACDCFVSLHRAEGFGLGIAEAMAAGKPAIATGYSGNMDFTSADNAFLVDYAKAPIPPGCDPYPQGELWAEPSVQHASELMVAVQRHPERALEVAAKGRADVERVLSPERIGRMMLQRLEEIRAEERGRAEQPNRLRTSRKPPRMSDHMPSRGLVRPGDLPLPPREMRDLVTCDEAVFNLDRDEWERPFLDASSFDDVFDFGCGCGRVARQLLNRDVRPRSYLGIDINRSMIRWCKENLAPLQPGFRFLHHDVYNVNLAPDNEYRRTAPFPAADGSASLVVAHSVFTHLALDQAIFYLREIRRVLRPGGVAKTTWFLFSRRTFPMMASHQETLFINESDPTNAVVYDWEWLRQAFLDAGFAIRASTAPDVPGHQWEMWIEPRRRDAVDALPSLAELRLNLCAAPPDEDELHLLPHREDDMPDARRKAAVQAASVEAGVGRLA